MGVLDYCDDLVLFSEYQIDVVKMLIAQYIDCDNQLFSYLRQINFQQLQFYWYVDTNQDVLGGFHLFGYTAKTGKYAIYINDFFGLDKHISQQHSVSQLAIVLQTILHQLKHFWQMKKYGWIVYFFLQLPIFRQITIQKQPRKISNVVREMNIAGRLTIAKQFILKCKYKLNNVCFSLQQINLKDLLIVKRVNLNQLYENKFIITLTDIKQFLKNI